MKFPRSFYVRSSYQLLKAVPELGIEVFGSADGRAAIAFQGKAQKPAFHYTYRSAERCSQHVAAWIEQVRERAAERAKARESRKAERHTLQVGDILVSSWGYEQTNIDYYEVTALIGQCMVELREIAQMREDTAFMQGKCCPKPGEYVGEPIRRRAGASNSVAIEKHIHASRVKPVEIGTLKVYPSAHWTAYA